MLYPENWQEYQWTVDGTTASIAAIGWRLWRVKLYGTKNAGGGIVTFGNAAQGEVEFSLDVGDDETIVLEPKGMFPAFVAVTSGTVEIVAEMIQRVPAP